MPIDHWLDALTQANSRHVDSDLLALADLPYPFLTAQTVCSQIELLSGHLAQVNDTGRRLAIAYSLYTRQMDSIQESSVRGMCAGSCMRPPVGCCNADHFVILSPADLMVSQPSATALQLSHVISGMQRTEHNHSIKNGKTLRNAYCSCLSTSGCTLRLFKSPRCTHYLCKDVEESLRVSHGLSSSAFIEAMRSSASATITSSKDFTNGHVLTAATAFLDLLP
ncbi:MAG: hypothetical protein HY795_12080 [Desulfovibrio sp.]|nr:hypothetical protein [Desulfovibrio sp.]MBI4958068.1 hypothetical protein [Desulfovibrio sp.]